MKVCTRTVSQFKMPNKKEAKILALALDRHVTSRINAVDVALGDVIGWCEIETAIITSDRCFWGGAS